MTHSAIPKNRFSAIFFAMLLGSVPLLADDHYAAPWGNRWADGSLNNPWDLQTALFQPATVMPGDTIWLRGGTYTGPFVSFLTGAPGNPIVVRQYPGERATLDGATPESRYNTNFHVLDVEGSYTWYWGFELTNSNTNRQAPSFLQTWRGDALWILGADTKFINLIVHDTDQGFSFWEPAVDSDLYGNLIYYNGWLDPTRGRGHAVYTQNQFGTKKLIDNIVFAGFNIGIHAYGTDAAHLDNFYLEGNTAALSGALAGTGERNILIGGGLVAQNPVVTGNYTYTGGNQGDNDLGYNAGCANPVVTNNYMAGGLRFVACSNIAMTGNTFYGVVDFYGSDPISFPNNTYYLATRPSGVQVFVRPNQYDAGRANITIFNWDRKNTVGADISGIGLQAGDSYELHNTEDYYGDVITGVWSGGLLQIPMTGHTLATPVGWTAPKGTYPEFGTFIIQKVLHSAAPPPPQPGSAPVSFWTSGAAPSGPPSNDSTAVELGLKFRSDVPGNITGISFYKSPLNVGTHTGQLWSNTGDLLAQGVFSGESASGWQQLIFDTPVQIAANTTYVAAYYAPSGNFSYDRDYFTLSGTDRAPLHALQSGIDGGNGVYLYSATPGFPMLSYSASNYWVDVLFTPTNPSGPSLSTIGPAFGVAGTTVPVTLTGTNLSGATLNLGTGLTANSVTVTATQVTANLVIAANATLGSQNITVTTAGGTSNAVNFTVNPPPPSLTSILPIAGVAGTTVPVTLAGTNLSGATLNLGTGLTANNVTVTATQITANLVIAANATPGSQNITVTTPGGTSSAVAFTVNAALITPPAVNGATIWPNSATPSVASNTDARAIEVGVKFRADVAGYIGAIRFYKGPFNTGIHTAQLFTSTGALLAQGTPSAETASGWQEFDFPTPVAVAANTTYVAAYHTTSGRFSYDLNYFTATGVDNTPLHALCSGVDGANGVYLYTATPAFPTLTYNNTNYWVDVAFLPGSSIPALASITPSSGVAGTTVPVTLKGTNLGGATLNLGASLTANNVVVSATQITANLVIAANASPGSQNITVTTAAGTSNSVSFTIGGVSLWPSSAVPSVLSNPDTAPIDVGVKFYSDVPGFITGVRFYKAVQNTGAHTVQLFTSTGTLLAEGVLSNETSSGWQEFDFPTAIPISANTAYIAAYYTPSGHFSYDLNYFASVGVDRIPLHALKNGADGPTSFYLYSATPGFPNNTYISTNYWVDVVFLPSAQ